MHTKQGMYLTIAVFAGAGLTIATPARGMHRLLDVVSETIKNTTGEARTDFHIESNPPTTFTLAGIGSWNFVSGVGTTSLTWTLKAGISVPKDEPTKIIYKLSAGTSRKITKMEWTPGDVKAHKKNVGLDWVPTGPHQRENHILTIDNGTSDLATEIYSGVFVYTDVPYSDLSDVLDSGFPAPQPSWALAVNDATIDVLAGPTVYNLTTAPNTGIVLLFDYLATTSDPVPFDADTLEGSYQIAFIPEPSTALLTCVGLAMLLGAPRRRAARH